MVVIIELAMGTVVPVPGGLVGPDDTSGSLLEQLTAANVTATAPTSASKVVLRTIASSSGTPDRVAPARRGPSALLAQDRSQRISPDPGQVGECSDERCDTDP
jgi:hypothetical protein